MFTYATVCSGVEGCSLALSGMGWEPVFFSEIEPFPCAVLKYHYPNVPNLGDMSKISYNNEKGIITNGTVNVRFSGRLDLLGGGTPCQDFSHAGKRQGGAEGSGTRSSLMWEWLRLARELKPRVLFWENVVGTFSSNGGRDFFELVRAIDALGYCVSWRVLDAQYTRVDKWPMAIPQRRRRVWLVGCAGGDVSDITKILFESSSLIGDTPPSRISREKVATAPQDGNRGDAPMVGGRKHVEGWFDNIRNGFPTTGDDVNHTVCTSSNYQGVIEEIEPTTPPSPHKNQGGDMVVGVLDMMGGKAGAHFGDGKISPTITHGRGSVGDVHAVASGVTFDAHMGFPTVEGASQTLKNGNSPGWANGVVEKVEGVDGYNFAETGEVSAALRGTACDFQHTNGVIVKNSKGGDVMPCINANESKLGGDNQHIEGGISSMNFELYDTATEVSVCLNARRAQDTIINTPLPKDVNANVDASN